MGKLSKKTTESPNESVIHRNQGLKPTFSIRNFGIVTFKMPIGISLSAFFYDGFIFWAMHKGQGSDLVLEIIPIRQFGNNGHQTSIRMGNGIWAFVKL